MGKKVLDDDALQAAEDEIDMENAEANEVDSLE
jgi:hypothetical protein